MDIHQATRAYEAWLSEQTDVIRPHLRVKHKKMSESPFVFLRGTFYRWAQQWPTVCKELLDAPNVLAIGDLHLENFGTWRDLEGRLIWGVNDVDEACELPYTHDLVRLATSVALAVEAAHLDLSIRAACEAILEGYERTIALGGRPLVLAERRAWLRDIALDKRRDPAPFWSKLQDLPTATNGVPTRLLRSLLPDGATPTRTVLRTAGVGSLGRARFVMIAAWGGSWIAREVKAAVPSATAWVRRAAHATIQCEALLKRAVRVPDPFFAVRDGWVVRRLAPDCTRIELTDLPTRRDEWKLLRAMGQDTANLHLGTAKARIEADLRRRPNQWLERAAKRMARTVKEDWKAWTARS